MPVRVPAYPLSVNRDGGFLFLTRPADVMRQFLGMIRNLHGLPSYPGLVDPCDRIGQTRRSDRLNDAARAISAMLTDCGIANRLTAADPVSGRPEVGSVERILIGGAAADGIWELPVNLVDVGVQLTLQPGGR
jgi:hypothetical protein